jgi:hypothetical protein
VADPGGVVGRESPWRIVLARRCRDQLGAEVEALVDVERGKVDGARDEDLGERPARSRAARERERLLDDACALLARGAVRMGTGEPREERCAERQVVAVHRGERLLEESPERLVGAVTFLCAAAEPERRARAVASPRVSAMSPHP